VTPGRQGGLGWRLIVLLATAYLLMEAAKISANFAAPPTPFQLASATVALTLTVILFAVSHTPSAPSSLQKACPDELSGVTPTRIAKYRTKRRRHR
jgi:hypothetical protein